MLFWKVILTESKQLDIDEPVLEIKKKASRRIEDCYSRSLIGFFHEKFEGFARQIYLLMQSKTGLSKRITNAKSIIEMC